MPDEPSIRIRPDGPYVVKGADLIRMREKRDEDDRPIERQERQSFDPETSQFDPDGTYALCRCGASEDKPFCDGSHRDIDFDGAETGPRESTAEPADAPASEPKLTERIAVLDDGPLYVQGAIPLQSSDGGAYQPRDRMTLCRCGASENKPYCDGSHSDVGFEDA